MNIFFLDYDPKIAAQAHCDKHVVKMILETAQLLSTAHRVLDGEEYIDASSGRKIRRWRLEDSFREDALYKATHINHPCAIWVRESSANYWWAFCLFRHLCEEYTFRYGKTHKTDIEVSAAISYVPDAMKTIGMFTEPAQAMPEECKVPSNAVDAYRNYYKVHKADIATWTRREKPEWFN